MKKIFTISVLSLFIFASAFAGDDGELNLSKKSKPVKDCFEPKSHNGTQSFIITIDNYSFT